MDNRNSQQRFAGERVNADTVKQTDECCAGA
jgi:hypothetical protein